MIPFKVGIVPEYLHTCQGSCTSQKKTVSSY